MILRFTSTRFGGTAVSMAAAISLSACRAVATAAPNPSAHSTTPNPAAAPVAAPVAAPDKKEPDPWDVNHPPGPTRTVAIDTDEGTWMSLDVSPDGKTIVFDLLGDLYLVPITGGTAKSLTEGLAWDMQPRFSPDGQRIAFTSDRDGADNLWILPVEGGVPTQVSKEDFRLPNSPAWSPDGRYLAARKHFTARRSLGSGEIWLFHVDGGKGVALTDKPNDEKDVGEPAFSPDGRFVYFSQDVTAGAKFEYNKDPYAGIYEIRRLDRRDGDVQTVVGGPGGAVRPTPSPDGRFLAFVRRIGLRTALVVHELMSGAEHVLDYELDRDMQETWAIHGVYPAMAWTPDSRELVYWRGGKIHRTEIATAKTTVVPFRVTGSRTVVEALRTPQVVHPAQFHTKMLRSVEVSQAGDKVVYQALGRIWIRDLPDGTPRHLSSDEGVFEFDPSFSRDGRQVVYVAWSDDKLGSVRVVPSAGGRGRTLSRTPGHYREPVFSPDGKSIVVRKTTGDTLVSSRYSHDPGLYALSVANGAELLLTRSGVAPHFGADPTRVFFRDVERDKDDTKFLLRSIALTRADLRTHLRSEGATETRVAPDGAWVAFREGFQAYVMPLPATGAKPIDVGPKSEGLPVARVSTDAGEYLHFSQGSSRLHWALGPQLFSVAVTDAMAGVRAKTPPAQLPSVAIDIGFDVRSDIPKGSIALVGGRIVTMRKDEVIDDGVVVITDNRIAAVGPRDQVTIPPGAQRFDVAGTTVIPGLVDVHAHGPQGHEGFTPQHSWLHDAELAFGVTTIHDPSNDTGEIFAAAELARAGLITAPRIFSTGTILYGAKTPFMAVVENLEDARVHLRRMQAVGAFTVKSYNQPRRNQRQQLIAAARELGMMVVPEGGSLFHHNMTMVVDGHTGVEHALPIARGYADMKQLWSGTEVGYTPTMVVGYGGLWGENYWYAHTNVFAHPRLTRFVPPRVLDARARRRILASKGDWNHFRIAALCKQLHDAGVNIQLGAHGQREGLAAHWELWMLVQGGMTPHEALRVGTLGGARYLGLDGDIGSIEVGKLADIAVLEGDVLADIRRSDRLRYTVLNGRVFDAATLDELAPRRRPHPKLYWQQPGG